MMSGKKKWRADVWLAGGLLLFGVLLGGVLLFTARTGKQVQIRVDGEVVETFLLSENISYEIAGLHGTNHLMIHHGEAWMDEASCPDGLCIHMGKISQTGQTIICLPNRVVVEIIGDKNAAESQEVDVYASGKRMEHKKNEAGADG